MTNRYKEIWSRYEVKLSPRAKKDLESICEEIASQQSQEYADQLWLRVMANIVAICNAPGDAGRMRETPSLYPCGIIYKKIGPVIQRIIYDR